MGNVLRNIVFGQIPTSTISDFKPMIDSHRLEMINSPQGHSIPLSKNEHSSRPCCVILYSHGNAEDVLTVDSWCRDIAISMEATVYAYDYCGYGLHRIVKDDVRATQSNIYEDILCVVEYLQTFYPIHQIVLYGRSLGCAPSIYAARHFPNVRGCILEAPFLTCIKTVVNVGHLRLLGDMFPNDKHIQQVTVPLMFIHGRADHVVPFSHSQQLIKLASKSVKIESVWVDDAGHNNLFLIANDVLFRRMKSFLNDLEKIQSVKTRDDFCSDINHSIRICRV